MLNFLRRSSKRRPVLIAMVLLVATIHGCAQQQTLEPVPTPTVSVEGKVALSSLIALTEGHLQKLSDDLQNLASSGGASSVRWTNIRGQLATVARRNVAAAHWFALADGSYWTVEAGRAEGNLAERPYWPRLMSGKPVMGDLVVSKSTGKNVAIVAVPVLRRNKSVAGVLGASVYLDKLSEQLKQEMGLNDSAVFYAVDSTPKGALHHDSKLIFTEPKRLGAEMGPAFDDMLSREEGMETYGFRGKTRTVLFRKSPKIGWWFAFGRLGEEGPIR